MFVWNDIFYSVDVYSNIMGREKVHILRFANNEQRKPEEIIPDFVKVEKDVRSDPQFSLRSIASAK